MNVTGLHDYQAEHAERMLRALRLNRGALDASDTGTGKTYVANAIARELDAVPLVICPKSVTGSWKTAATHIGTDIEIINYEKIRGRRRTIKTGVGENEKNIGDNDEPKLERALQLPSETLWGREIKCGKGSRWEFHEDLELVIFDEVHRCGGMTSLNSKMLIAARRQAKHVLCLSATAADDPRQLKALGYALRLFNLPEFKWWLLKHGCTPGLWGGFDLTGDSDELNTAFAKINKSIFPERGARMRKSEIPGFPSTRVDTILIRENDDKAKRLLAKLEAAYRAEASLEKLTEVRQRLELLRIPHWIDLAKDYSRTSKLVFFVNYTGTLNELVLQLTDLFKSPVPFINGENSDSRDDVVDRFQRNEFPAIVVNGAAGGEGIGLHDPYTQVERTAFLSAFYSGRMVKQILGRLPRDKGGFSQQFFTPFAGTVEERIYSIATQRLDNIETLNDAFFNGVL